jgi:hypothetical protein
MARWEHLLDVFRGRLKYPDLRRKVISLAAKYDPGTILTEDAGPGMALLQDLRRDLPQGMTRPTGQKPEGRKAIPDVDDRRLFHRAHFCRLQS